jgi:RNA polymerase sigma factor (sigma-70 family)
MKLTAAFTGAPLISVPSEGGTPPIFDGLYLTRLRNGDDETAKHFHRYFSRLLRAQFWGKFASQRVEDLVHDAITTAVQQIMRGEPRDASRLPGYVHAIGSNLVKLEMRRRPEKDTVELDFDRIPSCAKTPEELALSLETAHIVTGVLNSLAKRDRDVLVDIFFHQLDRDEACRKHNVTNAQLRLILFRARGRFQEQWRKQ